MWDYEKITPCRFIHESDSRDLKTILLSIYCIQMTKCNFRGIPVPLSLPEFSLLSRLIPRWDVYGTFVVHIPVICRPLNYKLHNAIRNRSNVPMGKRCHPIAKFCSVFKIMRFGFLFSLKVITTHRITDQFFDNSHPSRLESWFQTVVFTCGLVSSANEIQPNPNSWLSWTRGL